MIKKMSAQLSNLIAAGEVVEKPSNVIKELVENAIDALATHIDIYVSKDGMSLLSVKDNGFGMSLEDAKMSCERHATSKVYDVADLSRIKTLGFRGEALAAISSVSVVEMVTKTDNQTGVYLKFIEGVCVQTKEAASNTGTTITITELFHQTPARFKFLSSEYQHQKQHRQLFIQLALSHPEISMRLFEDEILYKQTTGSKDVLTTFTELHPSISYSQMTRLESVISNTKVTLCLASPEHHVSHKNHIYTFVNQRMVKYHPMIESIMEGYAPFLMTHRYPVALLYIDIDPSRVDINIHPQKLSVKLTNESVLKYHIESEIKRVFNHEPRHISRPLEVPYTYQMSELDFGALFEEENTPLTMEKGIPEMEFIGQLSSTYAIFQHKDGMYMMDIHAAAERVRYAYYQGLMVEKMTHSVSRLMPYSLSILEDTWFTYLKHKDLFESYGFEIMSEGIIKHPEPILEQEFEIALEYIFEMHQKKQPIHLSILKDALTKDVSCKGSVKANTYVSQKEIMHLFETLKTVENPYQCPHGRPIFILFTHYDIEKMFKRVVS
jgi:DNA mismatch repair protein MutL